MPYQPLPASIGNPKRPNLPPRTATAAETRAFLAKTLVTKYNFADEKPAEAATANWRIDRGAELHDASLQYFQQLFGLEVGFCLYQTVREEKQKTLDTRGKPPLVYYACLSLLVYMVAVYAVGIVWTFILIWVL